MNFLIFLEDSELLELVKFLYQKYYDNFWISNLEVKQLIRSIRSDVLANRSSRLDQKIKEEVKRIINSL